MSDEARGLIVSITDYVSLYSTTCHKLQMQSQGQVSSCENFLNAILFIFIYFLCFGTSICRDEPVSQWWGIAETKKEK